MFTSQLIDAMDNILREYGLIGYKETWCREEFPIAGYLKLKNYMQGNMLIDYVDEVSVEGSDLYKSKYVKEMQQLNEIIKPNMTT